MNKRAQKFEEKKFEPKKTIEGELSKERERNMKKEPGNEDKSPMQ